MPSPTDHQRSEMFGVLRRTHSWTDNLQVSGIEENTIVAAVHTALIERALRAGGVTATAEWLQGQADLVAALGHGLLAEIREQRR